MTQRIVTHVIRNNDGDILALCNPEESWVQRRKEWATSDILAHRHEYFVLNQNSVLRPIIVVNHPSGHYLRTMPDSFPGNNLDSLPIAERNPWEIALDDVEVLAVHAVLISIGSGQVLLMGGDEHDKANADEGDIHNTRLYDISGNEVRDAGSPEADVFCCGHAFLSNGRWLVGGGTEEWNDPPEIEAGIQDQHIDIHGNPRNHWSGTRECAAYRPADEQWDSIAPMLPEPGEATRGGGRWYPTLITLADGRVLAVGGHPRVDPNDVTVNDGRHGAWLPEIYDSAMDAWTYTAGHWLYVTWGDVSPEVELPEGQARPEGVSNYLYYPRLFVVPGGDVFLASPNDGHCGWYDPVTGMTNPILLDPPPHDGRAYAETNHTAVLLPLLPGDGYTAHILFLGYESAQRISLAGIGGVIDPANLPTWQSAGIRDWRADQSPLRRHGCSVLLPTGEIFFTGGLDHDETEGGSPDDSGVLEGEIYSAGIDWESNTYNFADEVWTTTPPASVVRNYHSVALLLPNGLVLTAGSNLNGSSGGDDVKEYRLEVYSPWYDGDPDRPRITDAPTALGYGESFQVTSSQASKIMRIALMRCGSVTHAWDGDQRYIGIEFELIAPGVLQAASPPGGDIAPPGPYMLWIIDQQGRPCEQARFLMLD